MKKIFLILYVAGAVVTFGHAWHRCASVPNMDSVSLCVVTPFVSALWPLYWSEELWRNRP